MIIGFRELYLKYRLKADLGGNGRYLPSQYESESYVHVNDGEGFGCQLAGLNDWVGHLIIIPLTPPLS